MSLEPGSEDFRVEFRRYIEVPDVLQAFDRLDDAAVRSTEYRCKYGWKGKLRECRIRNGSRSPYAFIINKRSLKFYFRAPAIKSGIHSKAKLAEDFGDKFDDAPNSGNEWTADLRNEADVDKLLIDHLPI